MSGSQHVLVCALHELGCLVLRLGTSASPLVSEPTTGRITFNTPHIVNHKELTCLAANMFLSVPYMN